MEDMKKKKSTLLASPYLQTFQVCEETHHTSYKQECTTSYTTECYGHYRGKRSPTFRNKEKRRKEEKEKEEKNKNRGPRPALLVTTTYKRATLKY